MPTHSVKPVLSRRTFLRGAGALSFADRAEVERILDQTQKTSYGVRSLVETVIQSPLFLSK